MFYPENPNPEVGLYAVRYKNFKIHFYTEG